VDKRPDSIGKAIPNAEILVLREDGSPCTQRAGRTGASRRAGRHGLLERSGKTAERYKPCRCSPGREAGLVLPEIAVFSGDTVRMDEEGFLYFIGRRDEMMKTSGYRVSPTEVEEILYATKMVGECVAFGVDDDRLGQAIQVIATPPAVVSWMSPPCWPNAAAACRPTWSRPVSTFAKARCRAIRMARSTGRPCRRPGSNRTINKRSLPHNTMSTSPRRPGSCPHEPVFQPRLATDGRRVAAGATG
jgi:acyl-coenzyme A synthetase/AMP-(fatty) acid ligase